MVIDCNRHVENTTTQIINIDGNYTFESKSKGKGLSIKSDNSNAIKWHDPKKDKTENSSQMKKVSKLKEMLKKNKEVNNEWIKDFEFVIKVFTKLNCNKNFTLNKKSLRKLNKIYKNIKYE